MDTAPQQDTSQQPHEELRRVLASKAGIRCSDGDLLAALATAAHGAGLSSKDVASKLSAWMINEGGGMPQQGLSSGQVERFVAKLSREGQQGNKENQSAARGHAAGGGATPVGKLGGGPARDLHGGAITPIGKAAGANRGSPLTPQSAPRTAFKARTNRGQVVSTLNPDIPAATGQEVRALAVTPKGIQLPGRHLYLLERLEDKVAAVNARIASWKHWTAAALAAAAAAGGSGSSDAATAAAQLEWAPVGAPAQEESLFAGRIVCEVEGGALNDTAVMLEGDTEGSEGARVHLDLSALHAYRLFPGQVVAVRGLNPSGSRILVKQLWSHLPPPPTAAQQEQQQGGGRAGADAMDVDGSGAELDSLAGGALGSSGGVTAVVAAGPFCLTDDATGYEPLAELLSQLQERPPNMLVLMGPFVDVEQPLIAGGMIDATFQQLFQTQVAERVEAWQSSLPVPCHVVLMPAVRDAFHHPTFPQPAINTLTADQQVTSVQNPCSFNAGPVLVSAETTDVLRHLSSVELAKAAAGAPADRLSALASHVVGQRRFYPLYPPPPGTCLDLTGDAALQLQQLPDLLLLPSDLAPFAKLVAAPPASQAGGGYVPLAQAAAGGEGAAGRQQELCVVNPGRLAKGSSGGTYAYVTVAEGPGRVSQRCRVDIIRV